MALLNQGDLTEGVTGRIPEIDACREVSMLMLNIQKARTLNFAVYGEGDTFRHGIDSSCKASHQIKPCHIRDDTAA